MTHLRRCLRSSRTWVMVGILAPLGMVVVCSLMLLDLRRDAWDRAEQTSRNLLQVIERDIDRNVEIIDLALRAVVENMALPGLETLEPQFRQRILFDRAVNAKDLGVMLVLDENGDTAFDAAAWPARRVNNAERVYFQAHKARADLGLYISQPLVSQLTGAPIIVLSRRIDKPDGSFGGVVLGSLSLSYFSRLFDRIELGRAGTINLFLHDGTRIVRYPEPNAELAPNFATSPNVQRFLRDGRGSFVGLTPSDSIERLYTFTQVGTLPLMLNVALSTREIEAEWRLKALVIGCIVLALCGTTMGLSLLVGGELRRRNAVEAELAQLSRTDVLTALPNRRHFEETFGRLWAAARLAGGPLALLVVDADHFKRYNDRHGHAVGDLVLQALAGALSASARRPSDLVARAVHEAVAGLAVEAEGGDIGPITVSIGLAAGLPLEGGSPGDLFRRADAALYEAKSLGRNRTCPAQSGDEPISHAQAPVPVAAT
ncbi:dethiobiotin synthetase [Methylobacterium indicum]|uniref:sensor domain-containing diguanylate cyclase n=2 Tax=Methylobacterium indicum TaxID=1775910 RepID=UPI000734FD43|nr:diguanylate cyclase [Methylobacterium indicum]KTS38650.1 dethiobiotin synthetase [Methylobacterium indicum]KTS42699.1 dethiobiotin synthetase [Methylobacterium indicum]KTS52355.1 dethiobiotin synthetase [Methylobacterium indicum]